MDSAANRIQGALQAVARLRDERRENPALSSASHAVKRFQARRFEATYADLLRTPRYAGASTFFLQELYSDKDYTDRDQQFSRIANTIARLFPTAVVDTAAALAEVHALTEQLDDAMARNWLIVTSEPVAATGVQRYINSWRLTESPAARDTQLQSVLQLGYSLEKLTRLPGLRTLLKMMRAPAHAAGLSSLQHFLESGFDAFASMRGAKDFLEIVRVRESRWITALFQEDAVSCETQLTVLLESIPSH